MGFGRRLIGLTFFLILGYFVTAQDVLFTQFFAVPTNLNPALTGAYEGNYRIGVLYRNQWINALDQGFETFSGGVDLRLKAPNSRYDYIGVGLTFFSDKSGSVPITQNRLLISGAFHKSLGYKRTSVLSAGFYIGPSQRNIDYGRIVFQDQFSGNGFSNPTAEILPDNNISFSDLGIGLNYQYKTSQLQAGGGVAVHHILEPDYSQTLNADEDEFSEVVSFKSAIKLYGWTRLTLVDEQLYVTPRFATHFQGDFMLYQLGSTITLANVEADSDIQLGILAKMGDSFDDSFRFYELSALIGIRLSKLVIGLSYDVNVRAQDVFGEHQGGFEVGLTYVGNSAGGKAELAPVF